MPPRKKKPPTTTAAAAVASAANDDDVDDDDLSLPRLSKKAFLAKTRADDAARANAAAAKAGTTAAAAAAVAPAGVTAEAGATAAATYAAADDDNDDADMVSLPPMPKLSLPFHKAAAAARAKSAAAKAGTSAAASATAAVAPASATAAADVSPYFASGAATTRATSLPRLSIFQRMNDMGRKSAAPATVSVPTELVAAAAAGAGRAEAEKAVSDGESFGSGFDFHDDISFSGGGDMGGVENEAVKEDAGVEGSELAAITSVFDCDHINRKRMNDKDGWECSWCGKFFTPLHATRALKHVLKIKKGGIIACKAKIPPWYLARYTALSGYHSDRIESGKQTTHKIDLCVESTQLSAASILLQKRGHDGGSSISSAAAASSLTGAPPLRH
jgi:hypothetical protein